MGLQDTFTELQEKTNTLDKAVKGIERAARKRAPQTNRVVNHFREEPLSILGHVKEAITLLRTGMKAAKDSDLTSAERVLSAYEKELQSCETEFKQLERSHFVHDLVELGSSSDTWKHYADGVNESMLDTRNVFDEIWSIYDKCRETVTEMRLAAKQAEADVDKQQTGDVFQASLQQDSLMNTWGGLIGLLGNNDSCIPPPGSGVQTFGRGVGGTLGDPDLNDVVNMSIANLVGVPLYPPVSGAKEKISFSDQVRETLSRVLVRKDEKGYVEYELQRGYFGPEGAAPSEEVRGRQATLYHLADTVRDASKELIETLVPLTCDCDKATVDFLKEQINSSLSGIVEEFGRVGGPISERVDSLIRTVKIDLQQLGQELGIGQDLAPYERKNMDIATCEQNVSNFELAKGYVKNLKNAWNDDDFSRNKLNESGGTRLARLSNTIRSIPETVRQIYWAMDLAGFSQVDRDSTRVVASIEREGTIIDKEFSMGAVLSWIATSAERDWYPRLRDRDARASELRALSFAVREQAKLVKLIIYNLLPKFDIRTKQFTTTSAPPAILGAPGRVYRALVELFHELDYAKNLVHGILSDEECVDELTAKKFSTRKTTGVSQVS